MTDTDISYSNIVEIKDLIKIYKTGSIEVIALNNLNLEVKREEILCIMGPSGSGKTTLLNQIGSIDQPSSGKIISCGKEISKLPEKELTSYRTFDVGFLFQDFNLSPVLTAEENIILPMKIAGKLSREAQRTRANELLKRVNLQARSNHKPNELSGGEKQRVALLAALANEPRLLISDEPTGELDSKSTEEILNLLKEFRSELGLTNIIVTHNNNVSKIADRVLHLKDGKIASAFDLNLKADGETASFELDSNMILKNLYPPKVCINCKSSDLKLQEPSSTFQIYARSTYGLTEVKFGHALCKSCGFITTAFSPVD